MSLEFHPLELGVSISRTVAPARVECRERWVDRLGRLCAWGGGDLDGGRLEVAGTGVFSFSSRSDIVDAQVPPDVSLRRVRRTYARIVLPLILQTRGWQVLHASAVEGPNGVVGLVGRSGAGKTTLAQTWARARGRVFADDALALRSDQGAARALEIPGGSGVAPVLATVLPLRALVVLEPGRSARPAGTLERLQPTNALAELLPHALCLDSRDRGLRATLFTAFVSLADTAPTYRLHYRQAPGSAEPLARMLDDRFGSY